ncbi:MAG TPA: nickel-responsive transcriptional regulator NikR [Candidatus Aerophobetes bacterium]|uniref:Putative nickel-responsive regulator n=1 Tax=Aerophobetes bacterium TaxID=2030807 RepID=A0A7V5I038_UNCAE|nr:nickel-responsive transcriptional regulator NikR [Candidatus Aerophobetes bacterium]
MSERVRFGVCLERELVENFDREIQKRGYNNRSKAIGDLIRDWLIQQKTELEEREGVGIVALLYDHEVRATTETLLELQHSYSDRIITTTHIHLDPHMCLEVLIVRGNFSLIREVAGKLSPVRGVKQVKVILTTHKMD